MLAPVSPSRKLNAVNVYQGLCLARNHLATRLFARSFAAHGPGGRIDLPVQIVKPKGISIGAGVTIGPCCLMHAHDDDEVRIFIGDRVSITGHSVIAAALSVRLGTGVLIGRGVHITDHNHGRTDPGVAVRDQGVDDLAPVVIGDGAWLADNVVVLPGVTIGAGAIIGANSVVRDDVPALAVAAGAPARVVAERPR